MILPLISFWSLGVGTPAASHSQVASEQTQAEIDRLVGHTVLRTLSGYRILDIAGQGVPIVGCVRLVDNQLFLDDDAGEHYLLRGPLAVSRIAGPNYKIWVLGTLEGKSIVATRLGILAAPRNASCDTK